MRIFVVCLIMGNCVSLWASQNWVISDIDDTIRQANVGNPLDAAIRLRQSGSPFNDLRLLYIGLWQKKFKFSYVSSSYPFLYNASEWVAKAGFPEGKVVQRSFGQQQVQYKIDTIMGILKSDNVDPNADLIIFFGDNAGSDEQVYNQVINNLKLQRSLVFIRNVMVAKPKLSKGLYYVSFLELFQNSLARELVDHSSWREMSRLYDKELLPDYIKGRIIEKKVWAKCPFEVASKRTIYLGVYGPSTCVNQAVGLVQEQLSEWLSRIRAVAN